jgi:hypothetical protein
MSLGGNFSSGQTQKLIDQSKCCPTPPIRTNDCASCTLPLSGPPPVAVRQSVLLSKKQGECPLPTPAEFALFPKIAVPSSVLTQGLMTVRDSFCTDPSERFAQYRRYIPPTPCPPLRSMAKISLPTNRECNL